MSIAFLDKETDAKEYDGDAIASSAAFDKGQLANVAFCARL